MMSELALSPRLVPFDNHEYHWQLPGDERFIVRTFPVGQGFELWAAYETKQLLQELTQDFGIQVVPFQCAVIGIGQLCLVADRLKGADFKPSSINGMTVSKDELGEPQYQTASSLLEKQYQYLSRKVSMHEPMLSDVFGVYQYIFPSSDSAVLIDIDPHIMDFDQMNPFNSFLSAISVALELCAHATALFKGDITAVESWNQKLTTLIRLIYHQNNSGIDEKILRATMEDVLDPRHIDSELYSNKLDEIESELFKIFKTNFHGV